MLNMFRMLIHPSSGVCDLFVQLFHGLYCSGSMCVGVTSHFLYMESQMDRTWEQTVVGSFLIAAQQFSVMEHYILTAHPIHHISMSHFCRYDCQTRNFFPVDRMAYAGRVLCLGSIKAERRFKHSLYLKWATYDLNIGFQSPCNSQSGVTCREVQILVLMSLYLATYLTIRQAASFSKDAIHGNGACIVWITWLGEAFRMRTLQTTVVHSYMLHGVRFLIPFHLMPNALI